MASLHSLSCWQDNSHWRVPVGLNFVLIVPIGQRSQASLQKGQKPINSLENTTEFPSFTPVPVPTSLTKSRLHGSCQRVELGGHKFARFMFIYVCLWYLDGRVKLFQSPMESIQIHHYHSWYEKTAGTSHWSRCYLLLEVRTRYSISPSRIIQERKGNCTRSYQKLLSGIIVGLRTACRVII